jgi:hypothetical protein
MIRLNKTTIGAVGIGKNIRGPWAGLVCATAIFLSAPAMFASAVVSSLHYSFKAALTNTGVDTDARGTVSGSLSRRGVTDKQSLKISLSRLDASTPYHVTAFLDDSSSATAVTDFSTERHGRFSTNYVKSTSPKAHHLPDVLDPLTNVRELDIVNDSGVTVSSADITNTASFSYSLVRAMDITGFVPSAGGTLRVSGTRHSTRVSVAATGLAPTTSYQLLVNGVAVTTKTSDRHGKLSISGPKAGLPLALAIRTVELADGTGANIILSSTGLGIPGVISTAGQAPVVLGAAATYAVLAGSTITSINATVITGDVGLAPGSAMTGFPPGIINGTVNVNNTAASAAKAALTIAYNDARGRTLAPIDVANADLGGRTLAPGLYKSTGTLGLTGTVTLEGDANSVFIFQVASALTTASGSQVTLSGGVKAANVFWQVGTSATLGSTTAFQGTIMADQSISMANGVTLTGRALARIAAVTMDAATITVPTP